MKLIEMPSKDGSTVHVNPEAVALVYDCLHRANYAHIMLVNGFDMEVALPRGEVVRLVEGQLH